jgi:hypothetical protein
MEKSKKALTRKTVFFILSALLVATTSTILEMALLEEWIISIERGTLLGTMTVIIGSIIVFAICMVLSSYFSIICLKQYKSKVPLESENNNLLDKTKKSLLYALLLPLSAAVLICILLQLFINGYFIAVPHGTHEGGLIAGIGTLIIVAAVILLEFSLILILKHFGKG